jgi:hypothetical protein
LRFAALNLTHGLFSDQMGALPLLVSFIGFQAKVL